MTVTTAKFRQDFPEFGDTTRYPDAMVTFWLNFAVAMLTPAAARWDTVFDMGVELMTAHQVTLGVRAGALAAPTTSKAVDKVSVSYDTSAVTLENGGHWNGTAYGVQFLQLARMIGAGGIQL